MAPVHHDHNSHTGQQAPHHKAPLTKTTTELDSSGSAAQLLEAEHTPRDMTPALLMNVQRIQGNQATSQLVARMIQRQVAAPVTAQTPTATPAPAAQTPVPPTQVSISVSDPPYSWMAKYEVHFTADECHLNVKVKLAPDSQVTAADRTRVEQETNTEFRRIFDNKFRLTEQQSQQVFNLRVNMSFVTSGEHVTVNLHAGSGRDNLTNWYVQSASIDRAHEMGHQIGLKDEYIDANAVSRQNATAPGVFTDNSIMGNYYVEGIPRATAHLRHGNVLAQNIGSTTGKTYTASMQPAPANQTPQPAPANQTTN